MNYAEEIRDALYKAHGLRAWELAIESERPDLLAYVEQHTGGVHMSPGPGFNALAQRGPWRSHHVSLCGVRVAAFDIDADVYDAPSGSRGASVELSYHLRLAAFPWLSDFLTRYFDGVLGREVIGTRDAILDKGTPGGLLDWLGINVRDHYDPWTEAGFIRREIRRVGRLVDGDGRVTIIPTHKGPNE